MCSWLKALRGPGSVGAVLVLDSVMQAACSALPKFDSVRREGESTPVRRTRYAIGVRRPQGKKPLFHCLPRCHRLGLIRNGGTPLTANGTAREVGQAFLVRNPGDAAENSYLPFHSRPKKQGMSARMGFEVLTFFGTVVREKHELSSSFCFWRFAF
jgi:hypothetical protein